jgi:hypothetical protein
MDNAFDLRQNDIKDLIVSNNVIILTSGTGLGKTTRVPLYMAELFTKKGLEGGYKIKEINPGSYGGTNQWYTSNVNYNSQNGTKYSYSLPFIEEKSIVLCAQPKELLAKENAKKDSFLNNSIKNIQGNAVKKLVGFRGKKNELSSSEESGEAITFVTSGWLSKYMINSNPYLDKKEFNVSCVIVDEAHERSIDIDKLLALLKKVLLVRPNFKIVIMSATINEKLFIKYFYDAPHIHIDKTLGDEKKVDEIYLPLVSFNYLYSILDTLNTIINFNRIYPNRNDKKGDIIVFISGKSDVDKLLKDIIYIQNIDTYQIYFTSAGPTYKYEYSRSNGKWEEMIISGIVQAVKDDERFIKIIFATNVVESSLTIESLRYVIDSGIALQSNYDPKLDINILSLLPITKASADQRKGRVGRRAPGICYRLFTKDFFDNMNESNIPDILKTNLESTFIELLSNKINFLNFDFIEPPSQEQTFYTMQKLIKYGVIDDGFNIYTDMEFFDSTNVEKYNTLNYIKEFELTIPNLFLQILFDYEGDNIDFLIQIILINSIYLVEEKKRKITLENKKFKIIEGVDWYSELFFVYFTNINVIQNQDFSNLYEKFISDYNETTENNLIVNINKYYVEDDSIQSIIQHINNILIEHNNKCGNGSITYNLDESDYDSEYTIYFNTGNNNSDYESEYTYISCSFIQNRFNYNLLSKI